MGALCGFATQAGAASVVYTYDLLGRVAAASYDNGLCIQYTYDANGNRTVQTNSTGGGAGPASPVWGTGAWGCFHWASAGGTSRASPAREIKLAAASRRRDHP